jgi:hypothetical protein
LVSCSSAGDEAEAGGVEAALVMSAACGSKGGCDGLADDLWKTWMSPVPLHATAPLTSASPSSVRPYRTS